jgi:hypothetical protein
MVSDRQKGLQRAIEDTYRYLYQTCCAHHISADIQVKFTQAAANQFWEVVLADSPQQYSSAVARLRKEHGEEVYQYITSASMAKERFVKYYVVESGHSRYGKTISNTVESMNGQLKEEREKPILGLLEAV